MISPLVRWEHSEDWYVTSYRMQEKIKSGERTVMINVNDEEQEFYTGHVIDGRNLFPATGYLVSQPAILLSLPPPTPSLPRAGLPFPPQRLGGRQSKTGVLARCLPSRRLDLVCSSAIEGEICFTFAAPFLEFQEIRKVLK